MANSKVEFFGKVLIDLTNDNVAADKMLLGTTAHDKSGEKVTGTVETFDGSYECSGESTGGGESTPTQEKTVTITKNGATEITPDEGYALSKVTANVNVPIPSGYIKPSGTKAISTNGTHNVTEYASVNVNVPSKEPVLQEKTVTKNGTVTPDSGYDGLSKVNVNVPTTGGGESNEFISITIDTTKGLSCTYIDENYLMVDFPHSQVATIKAYRGIILLKSAITGIYHWAATGNYLVFDDVPTYIFLEDGGTFTNTDNPYAGH